ncbi:MAG: hypothetical protein JWR17_4460 [Pseudomonas sp.]|jgi:putative membrane protein|uniref:YidH family protein n=1 Tax=Pseudomonas sp. TaxID=306 RepID=UPI002619EE6E|nr:DUF202 domain-containing protein [Pseudomonas sp.]MDB6051714.1 hypothetical protein [Pseudomonas sp.]
MKSPLDSDDRRSKLADYLLPGGTEPDPRFTLANERTFLAWMRTSLALLAGGIAVETFTADIFIYDIRRLLALLLMSLALLLSAPAFYRWLAVERAMRHRRALPFSVLTPILSLGVTVVIACFVFFVFFYAKS